MSTLHCLAVLDTAPDRRYDAVTDLLSEALDCPIVLVSLVDTDRQWFKSVVGLPDGVQETPRSVSFCAWTLLPVNPEVLVVADTYEDPRFVKNFLVTGEPHIRFYAGCPLITSSGNRLGSLCVIDRRPRDLTRQMCALLANWAELVVRQLDYDATRARKQARAAEASPEVLLRSDSSLWSPYMFVDAGSPDWAIKYANNAFSDLVGIPVANVVGSAFWERFHPADAAAAEAACGRAEARERFEVTVSALDAVGRKDWFSCSFIPADSHPLEPGMPTVLAPPDLRSEPLARPYFFVRVGEGRPHPPRAGVPRNVFDSAVITGGLATAEDSSSQASEGRTSPSAGGFGRGVSGLGSHLEVGQLLGGGPRGQVRLGSEGGTAVALKVVRHAPDAPGLGAGAARALLAGEGLSHPNLLPTLRCWEQPPGTSAIWLSGDLGAGRTSVPAPDVVETVCMSHYCSEGNLNDAVRAGWLRLPALETLGAPDWHMILVSAVQVADAVTYLHGVGRAHGHLSYHNILMGPYHLDPAVMAVYVADVGHSAVPAVGGPRQEAPTGAAKYCREGEDPLTPASDVYALGVNLIHMATSRLPSGDDALLDLLGEEVPIRFRNLVAGCLQPDPAQRLDSATVLSELEAMGAQHCAEGST